MAVTWIPGGQPRGAPSTLVEVLRSRAVIEGDRVAYTFLPDGEGEEQHLTYGELDREARAIAAAIRGATDPGQRALLLYPPGLHFISAFFGCLYAGVVAVPAYPPDPSRLEKTLPRLQAVAADSRVAIVLTTREIAEASTIREGAPDLENSKWLATDAVQGSVAEEWREPARSPEALAYLQYTSGSTAAPRGVMVSHANVLHNLALIEECFEHTRRSRGVIWLPPYHDMGLVGGVLQPLYVGFPVTLLSPVSFLKRPLRWLHAISRYRADVSGGPNFAYELCVRKIGSEQRRDLDLSSWGLAFSGAEPVRAETLDRFVQAFGPCGFRREAFYPCYGLAEATLIVSGGLKHAMPVVRNVERRALERGRAVEARAGSSGGRSLVGCGRALRHETVCVVDPASLAPSSPGYVGEIWVSGQSVAQGYWKLPEETERLFHARLAGSAGGTFLRTGDLGFLLDGELFVTGRLKDLIVIRGRNLSPSDIELAVGRSHPSLRPGCGAAFSIDVGEEERLVVAHEIDASAGCELEEVAAAIRQEVVEVHGIEVSAVVLIEPHGIPKTSSGKVQRHACRAGFLAGTLAVLHEWRAGLLVSERPARSVAQTKTVASIQDWLVSWLGAELRIGSEDIDIRQPFSRYGLASAGAVALCGDLEDFLGCRLSPTLLYEYPTIETLARNLVAASELAHPVGHVRVRCRSDLEPVAITGIGCRFPGADGPEAFWELLRDGRNAITEVPAARRDLRRFYDPDLSASREITARWGGFLDQVDNFDHHFFEISPREAARMDPQQRLLLEVAWESLEDAGQPPDRLAGTPTGVFIGISTNDYADLQLRGHAAIDAYAVTGNASSIAANRLSYVLDLRGPSMAVDTACSSSLVAVHLACQSLRNGESSLALAGGVNVILSPAITMGLTEAGVMAPDGRCKVFDARGDGYVRSEGVGVVVLKLLSKALADGDTIRAVIRGSAVNQDGRTNGILAPNPRSQVAVLREAYARAGVSPGEVQYVEAHGTGTFLGDPIEAGALGAVLAVDRAPGTLCAVGSVKTNIGHLEAAAGIAGLIKVALSLEHRAIPPSLHFNEPNPHIPFGALRLRVPKILEPWPGGRGAALAGVSSFGFGGTNAHVVLEESPAPTSGGEDVRAGQVCLLPISARVPEALRALAKAYRERFTDDTRLAAGSLRDMCYTASLRRSHHEHRLAVVARSREELAESLGGFVNGEKRSGAFSGRALSGARQKLVFVFPGQGPKWWPLARELLEGEVVFRTTLERCEELLRQHTNVSFLERLAADEDLRPFGDAELIQSAFFAVQVALVALWGSWGIEPDAVVGHSVGEVAAAQVAGVLGLEDAVSVVFQRGRLIKRVAGQGRMAVVELSLAAAREELVRYEGRLSIAATNSPTSTVLSGEPMALREVLNSLQAQGVFSRPLESVDFASHSPQMAPLQPELMKSLAGIEPRNALIPIVSTVTGQPCDGRDLDAAYWSRNLREPVLFSCAVDRLVDAGHDVFVEISPHPVLAAAISSCLRHRGREGMVLASLRRGEDGREVMLGSVGALYALGRTVDWRGLYRAGGRSIRLPPYPWQRERCWLEKGKTPGCNSGRTPGGERGETVGSESGKTPGWEQGCQRRRLRSRRPRFERTARSTREAAAPENLAAPETLNDCLYEPRWELTEQPAPHLAMASRSRFPTNGQGSWLIFTERIGVGMALETLLTARGEDCVLVFPAERYERAEPNRYLVNPNCPADFERLMTDALSDDARVCRGVVHMWSMGNTGSQIDAALDLGCISVLHLVQSMARAHWSEAPPLWLVTRGAQSVAAETEIAVAQSPVWGLGRVVSQEHPEFRCKLLDLAPGGTPQEGRRVLRELLLPGEEDEIALRYAGRYVHRLAQCGSRAGLISGRLASVSKKLKT